eukprot:m.4752 g.4752  ORF g.4752 m.4752 type:complete len:70 (-) comp3090_c0_seq1:20-229(-)
MLAYYLFNWVHQNTTLFRFELLQFNLELRLVTIDGAPHFVKKFRCQAVWNWRVTSSTAICLATHSFVKQ